MTAGGKFRRTDHYLPQNKTIDQGLLNQKKKTFFTVLLQECYYCYSCVTGAVVSNKKLRISAKPILSLWLCFRGVTGTACFHLKGTVDVQEYN